MENNKSLFDKNIETLTENKLYMLNLIDELNKEEYIYKDIITDIFFDRSMEGEEILGVRKENRDWYLCSRYCASKGVERWVNGCSADKDYGVAVIFGMANLSYIRALRKKFPEIRILVYEPDKYIWGKMLIEKDMSDIIADEMLNIVVGKIGELYLKELLGMVVDYANFKYMRYMISPNYDKIYAEECKLIKKIVYQRMEVIIVDRNTRYRFNSQYTVNRFVNTYDSLYQYNAGDIVPEFADIDFDKVPAVLVSAGPSLDKNVTLLKEIKGKAFIIAVDAAIRVLVKENIMPDMTITIDPNKQIQVLYADERIQRIPVLYTVDSKYELTKLHQGHRFYYHSDYRFINEIWNKYHKNYMMLETAGSVANDAFAFVRKAGFKTIILIGQDLAYTGDKVHSDNSYGELRDNHVRTKGKVYEIKDIYGNNVKTDYAMDIYRRWFEDQIRLHPEIHVIDATEGGALIEGSEIITFREAIDRECRQKEPIDFIERIHRVKPVYTKQERREIEDYLIQVNEQMKGPIKKKLQEAKRAYMKLEELNTKRKYIGSAFSSALKKVSEYNEWMTQTVEVDVLSMFADRESYEVMENILSKQEDQYQEIKIITDSGLKMINAYYKAADQYIANMNLVINGFMKSREGGISDGSAGADSGEKRL